MERRDQALLELRLDFPKHVLLGLMLGGQRALAVFAREPLEEDERLVGGQRERYARHQNGLPVVGRLSSCSAPSRQPLT